MQITILIRQYLKPVVRQNYQSQHQYQCSQDKNNVENILIKI
ncbi:hypothetical protein pb186bvf_008054 [Paramecium bursaria]